MTILDTGIPNDLAAGKICGNSSGSEMMNFEAVVLR